MPRGRGPLADQALESIVDDLYYLAGTPPYARLTIPPMPSALVVINLAAPFRVTHPGCRSPACRRRCSEVSSGVDELAVGMYFTISSTC